MKVNLLIISLCFYVDHIVSFRAIFSQNASFMSKDASFSTQKKNHLFQFMYIDYVDEYRYVLTMIKTW